jgi:DNA-binding NarL/FixJ family response regulator
MADAAPAVSVLVLGEARLFASSVERVLQLSGFHVGNHENGASPSVIVLVEPMPAHWRVASNAGVPAVVLTSLPLGEDDIADFIISGAEAVLPIDADSSVLVNTVGRVAAGDSGLTRGQARMLTECVRRRARQHARPAVTLTPRELEILCTIDEGMSVKQTARRLGISPRTVENTQRVLYKKLSVRNRAQAVATAHSLGLLPEDAE